MTRTVAALLMLVACEQADHREAATVPPVRDAFAEADATARVEAGVSSNEECQTWAGDWDESVMTKPKRSRGRHLTIWCAAHTNLYPTEATTNPMCTLTRADCHCAEVFASRLGHGSRGLPCREVSIVFCFRSSSDGWRCFLDYQSCRQERADYLRIGGETASGCQERWAR